MSAHIGKNGFIVNEGVSERYVMIQDDIDNTGGYLIFVSNTPDFVAGHDYWVLKGELEAFFQEAGWGIEWSLV